METELERKKKVSIPRDITSGDIQLEKFWFKKIVCIKRLYPLEQNETKKNYFISRKDFRKCI